MKFLRAIARVVVGVIFLFSGFVKVIDPVGVGLIVEEYFKIISITGWHTISLLIGVALSLLELLLGLALLIGLRMRITSRVTLLLMFFFTIVTLFLALFNPINDCGCFGEAIKLTHWESFFKDFLLLLLALLLYRGSDKFGPISTPKGEWIALSTLALLTLFLSFHSYRALPMIDFMELKVGTNIKERVAFADRVAEREFETILIYSKGGKEYQFSIDHLPDSSYTFVDSKSVEKRGGAAMEPLDFSLLNEEGESVTDSILSIERPLYLLSAPAIERVGRGAAARVRKFIEQSRSYGGEVLLLSGSTFEATKQFKESYNLEVESYFCDSKALYTLNRSFGGVTLLTDGEVIGKWSNRRLPVKKLKSHSQEDSELLAVEAKIRENLSLEIALVGLILLVIIIRYTMRALYKKRSYEDREE